MPRDASQADATDRVNPLTETELSPEQFRLLQTIIAPTVRYGRDPNAGWPVWDYVRRSLELEGIRDADDLVDALPWIVKPDGQPYGLVWRSNRRASPRIQPAETVGLTIPGVHRVDPPTATKLAWLVARYAAAEATLPLDPWTAATSRIEFADEAREVLVPSNPPVANRTNITLSAAGTLFMNEFIAITANTGRIDQSTGLSQMEVLIGASRFASFLGIESSGQYSDAVWQECEMATNRHDAPSNLSLAATLDYLDLVLRDDSEWPRDVRLNSSVDLQSIEATTRQVQSKTEFESAVSALWNLISRLRAPAATAKELDEAGLASPGSINYLDIWLRRRLQDDIKTRLTGRAGSAVRQVRSVGLIRQGFVHGSASTRAKSAAEFRALGLNPVLIDWSRAWHLLLVATASAFDAIREMVQHAGTISNLE